MGNNRKKRLARVIIRNSMVIFISSIMIILGVVFYFFQKEIMYNSMIYGNLTMENGALKLEDYLTDHYRFAEDLASNINYYVQTNARDELQREYIVGFVKNAMASNDEVVGVGVGFEPDKFDGKDDFFKNKELHDETGRFLAYVTRRQRAVLQGYQTMDYYQVPKKTLKPFVTDPFTYTVNGEDKEIITISFPLLRHDEFIGVLSCDLDINNLYERTKEIVTYEGNSSIAIVDSKGKYLTHSQDESLIGKSLKADCPDPDIRLKRLQNGEKDHWFEGVVGCVTYPIYLNEHQTPWQMQSKVHAKYVFKNVIIALYWMVPVILIGIIAYILLMRNLINRNVKPLIKLSEISQKIANGDLTEEITITSKNEVGTLADSFKLMVEKLHFFIKEIQVGSEMITNASHQLNSSSQSLSSSTTEQASVGEQVSSNMEEMSASVQQNTAKSNEVSLASKSIVESINELHRNSQEANTAQEEVTTLIDEINAIAQNIKLLSLNASVEAARAGEHGKGFAVVAREVQKLSENTAISTQKITEKIKLSGALTQKSSQAIDEVVPLLDKLNSEIEDVNIASHEQAQNIVQVTNATQVFNSSTQANAASAEELASTAEELSNQAERLLESAKLFKV